MGWRGLVEDERGGQESVGALISLAILGLFVVTMGPVGVSAFSQSQEMAQHDELEILGQSLASNIESIDRQARASPSSGPIGTTVHLADTVGNQHYTITIQGSGTPNRYVMILELNGGDVSERLPFRSRTSIDTGEWQGGTIRVIRKSGQSQISIEEVGTN